MLNYYAKNIGNIHYHKYGIGKEYLFVFHGYGMDGKQFEVLPKFLFNTYTIIGINLFFHEGTILDDSSINAIKRGLQKKQLLDLLNPLLEKYQVGSFSVAGYSLGANYALGLVELYADRIKKIYLFAPDGLKENIGLRFFSNNRMGNWIFEKLAYHPYRLPWLLKQFKRFKIINSELFEIAYNEVDTAEKRLAVFSNLTYQRNLLPNLNKIEELILQFNTTVFIVFGKQDSLFPKKNADTFLINYKNIKIIEVDLGHWLLVPELDNLLTE